MPQEAGLAVFPTAATGRLRLVCLASIDELRAQAAAWDDLWQRSRATIPLARAETLAQLTEWHAPKAAFRALVVEDQGVWVAGLPLMEDVMVRSPRLIGVGRTPVRGFTCGELLLDQACDMDRVLDCLVAGFAGLPWGVVWLDDVLLGSRVVAALKNALVRAGMFFRVQERYDVARIEIDHDWEAFTRRWSGAFRRQNGRLLRRLAERGEVRFETRRSFDAETAQAWVRRGFEVEHRSWKGREGSSVLATGQLEIFVRYAQQLARWGQLQLTFLECADRPIAFVFGATAKGVHYSCKVGYDVEYARYNPGQLLYYRLFEHLWNDPGSCAQDFWGVAIEAHTQWKPELHRCGRLVVAPRGFLSRAAVRAFDGCWHSLRRLRSCFQGDHSQGS